MKQITVAILGCGSRGFCYGEEMQKRSDKFTVVSVCDISMKKLERAKRIFSLSDENLFLDEIFYVKIWSNA